MLLFLLMTWSAIAGGVVALTILKMPPQADRPGRSFAVAVRVLVVLLTLFAFWRGNAVLVQIYP